jgi:hypothetical protein
MFFFITPAHPLIQQAAHSIDTSAPLACNLISEHADLPEGHYPYAIYRWRKIGLKEDFTFQTICSDSQVNSHMMSLLEKAKTSQPTFRTPIIENLNISKHTFRQAT